MVLSCKLTAREDAMNRCKDCRFWEEHGTFPPFGGKALKTWHECERPEWVAQDATIPDDAIALYADASDDTGLNAGMKTGPLFGCILWQAKDPEKP
jgi:hypothetical protein